MTDREIDIRNHYKLINAELHKYPKEFHEELTQAGVVALVKAQQAFDSGRGAEFTTYAYYKVHYEMLALYQDLTKNGNLLTTTFTDLECHIDRGDDNDGMSFEEVIAADWNIEDFISGLSDSSIILSEVDALNNRLQRISVRYLTGLRDHAKIRNQELASMLGVPVMRLTRAFYEAKKHLRIRPMIIELAAEKGIVRRQDRPVCSETQNVNF